MVALQLCCLGFIDTVVVLFANLISYNSLLHLDSLIFLDSPVAFLQSSLIAPTSHHPSLTLFFCHFLPTFFPSVSPTFLCTPLEYPRTYRTTSQHLHRRLHRVEPSGPRSSRLSNILLLLFVQRSCLQRSAVFSVLPSVARQIMEKKRRKAEKEIQVERRRRLKKWKGSTLFFVAAGSCCSTMPINKPLPFGCTSSSRLVWHSGFFKIGNHGECQGR